MEQAGVAPHPRKTGGSRKTIGVFTAQFEAYQTALWRGIETRARQRGAGVISFLGHRLESPVPTEAAANVVYRIADRRNVDGLIVITTAIATFLDPGGVERFFASRPEMPQVSVGLAVPGIPSITVDSSNGVSAVVRHLVGEHGRARFALIGGPPGHAEAEDRSRTFRRALAEEGIDFDERLAVSGTFLRDSGAQSARQLLETGLPFDALICMNDHMALGALEVLREAGIRVPEDLAVAGFDGIEEARYVNPPLTTIAQPLEEMGSLAVDELLAFMGGAEPRNRVLSCAPVFRQSCGCPPRRRYDAGLTAVPARATEEERSAISDLERLAVEGRSEAFIARLDSALAATSAAGGDLARWNDYLSVIRSRAAAAGAGSSLDPALFEFARVLVGECESRRQAARRVAAEERLATLRSISAALAGAFEMPVMLDRLQSGLFRLGIDRGYLVLFDGGDPVPGRSRLVMARQEGRPEALPAGGIHFQTVRLLPPRVKTAWRRGQWVLEPLVFQSEPLGYLLLPGGADEPVVYDTLREQVASALKGTLLLEQVRTHERRLEAEVARRTAELIRANEELTREIERRMRLEGEVLEISNRTMQRIGQDLHDDLCQHLAGIAMLASALRGDIPESARAAAENVDQISRLLAESIRRAKQIARGLYPAWLEEHGLVAAVEELVESARRRYPAAIEFRASPDFLLPDTDRALQMYRIVQEALSNALKHGQSERIEVRLYRDHSPRRAGPGPAAAVVADVTDHGRGLPRSIRGRGMGLRIMRYRAEMAGAELRFERLDPGTRVSCRIPLEQGDCQ